MIDRMTPTPTPPCLGEREAVARTEELTAEEIAEITAADPFCQPAPPSIPVRGPYYLTECEHCGWIGSSEQCSPDDEDVICPACLLSICGDGPSEADTAKHGEAVYQRIVTAEAAVSDLTAKLAQAEGEIATMRAALESIKQVSAVWVDPGRLHTDDIVIDGGSRHHKVLVLQEPGRIAHRALTNSEHSHGE